MMPTSIFIVVAVTLLACVTITVSSVSGANHGGLGYTWGPTVESSCTTFLDAFWCPITYLCTIAPGNASAAMRHCNRQCLEAGRLEAAALKLATTGSQSYMGYSGSTERAGSPDLDEQGSSSGAGDASQNEPSNNGTQSICTDFSSCTTCASEARNCGACMFAGGVWSVKKKRCFPTHQLCNVSCGADDNDTSSCIDSDGACPACERYSPPLRCFKLFPIAVSVLVGACVFAVGGVAWVVYHWGQKDEELSANQGADDSKSSLSGVTGNTERRAEKQRQKELLKARKVSPDAADDDPEKQPLLSRDNNNNNDEPGQQQYSTSISRVRPPGRLSGLGASPRTAAAVGAGASTPNVSARGEGRGGTMPAALTASASVSEWMQHVEPGSIPANMDEILDSAMKLAPSAGGFSARGSARMRRSGVFSKKETSPSSAQDAAAVAAASPLSAVASAELEARSSERRENL